MDDREFEKILASAEQLRLREKQAEPWTDRYSDMNSMEKSMLLDELFALRKADKEERDRLLEKLDRMTEQLMNLNESSQRLLKQNEEQQKIIFDLNKLVEKLQKENAALKEQKKQDRKNLYGSKSQKISRKKKEEAPSHEENKDDFDGTSGPSSISASDEDALSKAPEKKEERPYRKGMSYKRMKADKSVCHDSDFSRLPKDAVIIKTFYKYSYQQISDILEHKYQIIRYKQSDGYNVYMYIDKELVDTEHLCCLAHARAKFVYAYEQSDDPDAKYLIDCFGELYQLEDTYKLSGLSAQEITRCRHSLRTKEIIGRIRSKLDVLLSPTHPPRGELMDKAVNYLQVFWKQLFAYLNDGRYDIDNSIAERFIRPLAGERKNSLFFVGSRMANVSAAYHTLLSTCRMNGLSALEYLKKFFHEIVKGRNDYENLLPMTIGINTNKY